MKSFSVEVIGIKICSYNIQNKYYIKKYNGVFKRRDSVLELVEFIEKNNIDILGVQELVKNYEDRLKEVLPNKYTITGKYRFTRSGNILSFIKRFNESVSIISNKKLISSKTITLPFLPNIPRIATINKYSINDENYIIINTHLDYSSNYIKRKQLLSLIDLLSKYKSRVIFMGDFNLTIKNPIFKHFIKELEKLGYSLIQNDKKTQKNHKNAIDHIFVSNDIKVINFYVDQTINISDHYPLILEI